MTLSRRRFLKTGAAVAAAGLVTPLWRPSYSLAAPASADGPFQPTWDSLAQYQTPDWFRDAKFGIWAHWGPQCQPEQGAWYARNMYTQDHSDYKYQCAHYGHPSKAGFKEVIRSWKAESWNPEHLIGLYQAAGAKYFMCLANHHDNFDCYASTYQSWNSVALGPQKDLVGGWEKAARAAGLRFAVSVHAARTWSWYETAQGADKTGPLAGVPYDGHLTQADGKELWWDGLDPQELYAQNHALKEMPSQAYIDKFYNRTIELIDKYQPDLLYFDDSVMPLNHDSDAGLRIAAHLYNSNMKLHGGKLEAVMTTKALNEQQRKCLVWDIERGVSNQIEPLPWQTDTCIGSWHYNADLFHRHGYKKPGLVAHTLVDIVSKNGNLMLNIPLPGNGMPDADELAFVADFTKWMQVNSEGIYATRPWKISGEGPAMGAATLVKAGDFNEKHQQQYTSQDFRFMQKGDTLYAFALAWPDDGKSVTITSLGTNAPVVPGQVTRVELLGTPEPLKYAQGASGLTIALPAQKPCDYAYGFKISGSGLTATA